MFLSLTKLSTCRSKVRPYLVHFLGQQPTLAERYHNALFEGTAVTSGRLLVVRFPWATFRNALKAYLSGFQFFRKDDGPVPLVGKGRRRKIEVVEAKDWTVTRGRK